MGYLCSCLFEINSISNEQATFLDARILETFETENNLLCLQGSDLLFTMRHI